MWQKRVDNDSYAGLIRLVMTIFAEANMSEREEFMMLNLGRERRAALQERRMRSSSFLFNITNEFDELREQV